MKGRTPKPPSLLQRRNVSPTKATLPSQQAAKSNPVPDLPVREKGWHPKVVEWWRSVWTSPMASEYLDADMRGGMFLLARLHQAGWEATEPSDLINAAKEIRQQETRFGLSPIDRRRLQWTVSEDEAPAVQQGARKGVARVPKDPRAVLKLG